MSVCHVLIRTCDSRHIVFGGLSAQRQHTVLGFICVSHLPSQVGDVLPVLIMSCKAGCDCGCWFESQRGISIQSVHCAV